MKHQGFTLRTSASRIAIDRPKVSIRELAEAGASGQLLTPVEIRQVCEAFRARAHSVRNQFHSGT